MRPTTLAALIICGIIAVSAFVIGILFDLEILSRTFWWSVIKNGGLLAALFFALIHWIQSRPKILKFSSSDWNVPNGDWSKPHEVTITIPAKFHKRGKTPSVIFLSGNDFSDVHALLNYRTKKNGDIVVRHDETRFDPANPKPFRVKITA